MNREAECELIDGHVYVVRHALGIDDWPDGAPDDPDALAAWAYVEGYANALDMTARELIDALEL